MRKRPPNQARKRRLEYIQKLGKPPGSIEYLGDIKTQRPVITLFDYDVDHFIETVFTPEEISQPYVRQHPNLWLNVHGINDPKVMEEIGRRFKLHPLVLEDITHTHQRPKLDDYDDYLFIVLRVFDYDAVKHKVQSEQISLILGHNFVLSFQERSTGLFSPVRERLRKQGNLLNRLGSAALLHALIDVIVDRYFVVAESVAEEIENLENNMSTNANSSVIAGINYLKRELQELRRVIWPTREVLNSLLQRQAFLNEEIQRYFRDIYDHTVHILDMLDSFREQLSGLLDIHLSTVSNRLNAEVRVLTVITTLFAPATLVTGFFGMNFHHMPWLERQEGWVLSIALILGAGVILIALLFLQRWLSKR